ncbi:MAG: hypothetical protein ACXWNU_09075 [Candidatus Binataceae bacterium]
MGDAFPRSLNVFPYRLVGSNLIALVISSPFADGSSTPKTGLHGDRGGGERKAGAEKIMGWKLTFALMVISVAVVSALAGGGESENEATVREEATAQLSALREYLLRR